MLCGSHIKIWNIANHMKKTKQKHQNAKFIVEKLETKGVMFFVSFFFKWFTRFQILTCEPQSIWRKLLLLSWLYAKKWLFFAWQQYRLLPITKKDLETNLFLSRLKDWLMPSSFTHKILKSWRLYLIIDEKLNLNLG